MTQEEFIKATATNDIVDMQPYEIANALSALTRMNRKSKYCEEYKEDLVEAVCDLKELCSAFASPDYNRTLYMALIDIANRYRINDITLKED